MAILSKFNNFIKKHNCFLEKDDCFYRVVDFILPSIEDTEDTVSKKQMITEYYYCMDCNNITIKSEYVVDAIVVESTSFKISEKKGLKDFKYNPLVSMEYELKQKKEYLHKKKILKKLTLI